jgi:dTMP kinase
VAGRFIVFEGGEGAGKTTQLQLLQVWFEQSGWLKNLQQQLPHLSQPLLITREPGGTHLGQQVRRLLLDPQATGSEGLADRAELLLYAADRAQHVETKLKPHLAAGGLVLCDRFTGSTIAYQGYGRGLDLQLIDQLNQIATAGITVDLTFWLDLDVKMGLERARQRSQAPNNISNSQTTTQSSIQGLDRIESIEIDFHQRIREGFQTLQQANPAQMLQIDATVDIEIIAQQIQSHLAPLLHQWYPQQILPQIY